MKPLTHGIKRIRISKLDPDNIEKIDFLFKESDSRHSRTIEMKTYDEKSADVKYADDHIYELHFTPEETEKFPNGQPYWIDIRPVTKDGIAVPVKMLKCENTDGKTLYTRGDIGDS